MSNSKRQNILVISEHYFPEIFRINEVVQSLHNEGQYITVLTGQPNYPEGKIFTGFSPFSAGIRNNEYGISVARVPITPRGSGGNIKLLTSYASFLASSCTVGTFLLRGKKFDAILFYGVSPLFLALTGLWFRVLKKAPLILWVQDLWPGSLDAVGYRPNAVLTRMLEAAVRRIYLGSDLILVASKAFEIDIRRITGRDAKCVYHPNPAEIEVVFAPKKIRPAPHPHLFEIVFAGNLGRASGLDTIVEAAALLRSDPSVKFRLVGNGSRRGWLEQEISRLGLTNITIENRVRPDAIPAILDQASALLVSLTRSPAMTLSLPSKTSTYMASGRPLIVSADGETARIVTEAGAGLCVPAQDPAALAAAIKRLQSLPEEEREAMGAAARAYSRQWFDPSRLATRLVEHLSLAIESYRQKQEKPGVA